MTAKAIIVLDAEGIDEGILAAAGLRRGQAVVAQATSDGLLLRAASDADLAAAESVSAADVTAVLRRYPATIDRLGR